VDIVQRHWAASRRLTPTDGDAPRGGRSFTRAAPMPSHSSDPMAMDPGETASAKKAGFNRPGFTSEIRRALSQE
jgi:hypothetical protein